MTPGPCLLWAEQICSVTILLQAPVPGHLEGTREAGLRRQELSAWPFLLLSLCSLCLFLSTSRKTAGGSIAGFGFPLHQARPGGCCAVTGAGHSQKKDAAALQSSPQFPAGMKFPGQDRLGQPVWDPLTHLQQMDEKMLFPCE